MSVAGVRVVEFGTNWLEALLAVCSALSDNVSRY